jgi:hypothetical protein
MTLWSPTWSPGAEVRSLDGRHWRIFEQYPDGTTLVMPEGTLAENRWRAGRIFPSADLLPVFDPIGAVLDVRVANPPAWCRRTETERIGARERAPTPTARCRAGLCGSRGPPQFVLMLAKSRTLRDRSGLDDSASLS